MRRRAIAAMIASAGVALPVAASTYFPISDDALRARSSVVAFVRTIDSQVFPSDELYTETRTRCLVESVAQGSAPTEIEVAIPGGRLPDGRGSYFWLPELAAGHEYLLFLQCRSDGRFSLAEGALGVFEIDTTGTFARRPAFPSGPLSEVLAVDDRKAEAVASPSPAPQWVSFNPDPPTVVLARWTGNANVDIGFLDDDPGDAPDAALGVPGGGVAQIEDAIDLLAGDPTATIKYHYVGERSATLTIHLDNTSEFGGEGFGCQTGIHGELGRAGITFSGNHNFKGASYNTLTGATIWIRRWDCITSPFLDSAFENSMTHELGHTLGLGHPDQGVSPHYFGPDDWDPTLTDPGAVMLSTIDFLRPTGLNQDDIAGLCYLYGTCDPAGPPAPARAASGVGTASLRMIRGRK